ncbi:MAG: Mrp/NBP35 family ATP-binding protein [Candidatus Eisenbacteria bacterium]|nr:Mrp/NBP35 family ATP-binding protein [Candidatus Eisenbacteria bacterium]
MKDGITKEAVLDALRAVKDPDLERDIVSLGFVKKIETEGGAVRAAIEIATPLFPSRETFRETIAAAIAALGADPVEVNLTCSVRGRRPAEKGDALRETRNVVAVASGKGGVGKSTVAVNLAIALSRAGAMVGLMDADVYGPSTGIMLGAEGQPGTADGKRMLPIVAQGIKMMSIHFLVDRDRPLIWRGPMVHNLISQFLDGVDWGPLDYLVIDLPPGTGDAQLTLSQKAPLSGAVIVSTPQDVSLVDARKGLRMFEQVDVPVLGIVENMSYFLCPHCGGRTEIFGHGGARRTAEELGMSFLGEIPIDPEVVAGGDRGEPITAARPESPAAVAFTETAERIAVELGRRAIAGGGDDTFFVEW